MRLFSFKKQTVYSFLRSILPFPPDCSGAGGVHCWLLGLPQLSKYLLKLIIEVANTWTWNLQYITLSWKFIISVAEINKKAYFISVTCIPCILTESKDEITATFQKRLYKFSDLNNYLQLRNYGVTFFVESLHHLSETCIYLILEMSALR